MDKPDRTSNQIMTKNRTITICDISDENIDKITVKSFGDEWTSFYNFSDTEISVIGDEYFDIITDKMVNQNTIMADFGCGSGRFTKYWQQKVKKIVAIDPSDAIFVADELIGKDEKVELVKASISDVPFPDNYFDFGMSIGVLHHIPDTQKAMSDCVKKVKEGGYFYTYLYYSLDNRGFGFKLLWQLSNIFRVLIASMPQKIKAISCDIIALFVYMPFVLIARGLKKIGVSNWAKFPLSIYENKSFFVIRNDALDRFGTPLEQRFSKTEIREMMQNAGLTSILFSEYPPYWHAVGQKIKLNV